MKTTAIRSYNYYACRRNPARYPNCASKRYVMEKFLDTLLAAAITVAVVAILLFLFVLF